jgi:hypothetical protein
MHPTQPQDEGSSLATERRQSVSLIRVLDQKLTDDQRARFIEWGKALLAIRSANWSVAAKARRAIQVTRRAEVVLPVLTTAGMAVADLAWRDRGWSARLGLSAAVAASVATGGQSAGIAALGTAIGVPLWVVLGAGATFAGAMIDELQRSLAQSRGRASGKDPEATEAKWEFIDEQPLLGSVDLALLPAEEVSDREEVASSRLQRFVRRVLRSKDHTSA